MAGIRPAPSRRASVRHVANPAEATERGPRIDVSSRVLLTEDHRVNQVIAQRMLELMGCDVEIAEDGAAAVSLTRAQDFDLILMDCQMPELDGLEATAQIRADPGENQGVSIVALTAGVMVENRESCIAAGMDDFLSKPINKDALKTVVNRTRAGLSRRAF